MSYSEDATYLEERILIPLQRAVQVMRQVGQAEITLSQKQDVLNQINVQISAATNKHAELQASIEHMKTTNAEQRMELQALLQEDRRTREQERRDHLKIQEQRKEEIRDEQIRMDKIKLDREQAERQLEGLRADLSKRLQTLQGLAS
jgi:chromosome segregation ATPase